ncbi:hypothetical protein GCM10010191_69740 [Actinomadura vinacea]|uniref:Uncharacterized protein n=1 Tax=Actinomadura vinacea TaxID=115336 RepID=A0ABP5X4C3_9ACTN
MLVPYWTVPLEKVGSAYEGGFLGWRRSGMKFCLVNAYRDVSRETCQQEVAADGAQIQVGG